MTRIWRRIAACSVLLFLLFDHAFNEGQVMPMLRNRFLQIDDSHLEDGYFTVECLKKTNKKIKIIVQKNSKNLTYNIYGIETIPCNLESGKYTVVLYENNKASRYTPIGQLSFTAMLNPADSVLLHPNQYVDYTDDSPCVKKAKELCINKQTDKEKFYAIKEYIDKSFIYDYVKAVTTRGFILPDIHTCFRKKMGICQDLAAMAVAMLRSQGVPASLVIGYADAKYHAWVEYDNGQIYDPTKTIQRNKKKPVYIPERYY